VHRGLSLYTSLSISLSLSLYLSLSLSLSLSLHVCGCLFVHAREVVRMPVIFINVESGFPLPA